MVDLKQSGRFPGLEELSSKAGEGSMVLDSTATRLPSTAAIVDEDSNLALIEIKASRQVSDEKEEMFAKK